MEIFYIMNISKEDYFKLCAEHDWFYSYSDDASVNRRGYINETRLKQYYSANPDLETIYIAWKDYNFSGEPFGIDKLQKPILESFI